MHRRICCVVDVGRRIDKMMILAVLVGRKVMAVGLSESNLASL